ncbi:MAG: rhomboid family intramembrane serine protease, partial [Pseudomonadales bacterium]|nr:rhomboid family intramembrane serine protease [Pseudomonadales bacterium]
FVHDSWWHLISNTMPLVILGGMVLFRGVRYFGAVTFMIMLLGGILLWCFGRNAAHIGASGLAFGYLGFLVTRGFYERSWQSIGVAALVVFLYGGMIFGVVPRDDGVSWEAHLFGLLAGMVVARVAFGLERRRQQALADEQPTGARPARTSIDLER